MLNDREWLNPKLEFSTQYQGESGEERERWLHEARAELDKRMDALRKQNEDFYSALKDTSQVRFAPVSSALYLSLSLGSELHGSHSALNIEHLFLLFTHSCCPVCVQRDKTRYRDAIRKVDESIAILEQLFDETRKNLERLLGAEVRARCVWLPRISISLPPTLYSTH